MHAAIQDSETFDARSVNEESGETQVVEETGNEGEVTEDTTNKVLYQCSICFDYGHNKRTCPHLGRRGSESDEDHTNAGEEPGSRETDRDRDFFESLADPCSKDVLYFRTTFK